MTYKDIIKRLSLEEKESLLVEIQDWIVDERNCLRKRARMEDVRTQVCDTIGLPYNAVCRKREFVVMRVIIANLLIQMGYSIRSVGKFMEKSRCEILFYQQRMKDWLEMPKYYEEELNIWYKVNGNI